MTSSIMPISKELMDIVRQRQLEVSIAKGKMVSLREVSDEIVRDGLINAPDLKQSTEKHSSKLKGQPQD